jgi:cytochrome b561
MQDLSRTRYGGIAQLFHWATAILVLVAFIYGPGGPEDRVYGVARDAERRLHETLGLCVFALVVLRVLWKLVDQRPAPLPMARWMQIASHAVQGGLYLLLFAVPMTAVAGAWLTGHPLTLLTGIDIAPRLAESHDLGATIAEVHGWLGDVILWLAGAHAVAALYHHFRLRDGVLVSMLPSRFAPPAPKRNG